LSDLIQTAVPVRPLSHPTPAADCPKNAKRARSPGIFGRVPAHLELTTIWH